MKVFSLFGFVLFFATVIACQTRAQSQEKMAAMPPYLTRIAEAVSAADASSMDELKENLFTSLIFEFVRYDNVAVIKKMIGQKANLKVRDADGNSLLHHAAGNGTEKMTRLLLDAGVEFDGINQAGRSPLCWAAISNRYAVAEMILKAGADVDGNSDQSSPLAAAAWYGFPEIVKLLMANKANIEKTDSDGNTPLHKAVWQGNAEVAELLLNAGANRNAKNDVGQSPVGVAADRWKIKKSSAKRAYGTEQVIGPPDVPTANDNVKAWCPSTANQPEWLVVHFENAVIPAQVEVYENMGPGMVGKVVVFDRAGKEKTVWSGKDPAKPNKKGVPVASIDIEFKQKIKKLKIYIDSHNDPQWNEIDAIGLIDKNGDTQWASWVDASSCYAGGNAGALKHLRVFKLMSRDGE